MAEEKVAAEETPYLATWKTKEEAEEGLANLNSKLGEQGKKMGDLDNAVSSLTNELQMSQRQMQDIQNAKTQEGAGQPSEAQAALADVTAALNEMETDDPKYIPLQNQRVDLVAQISEERAIKTASKAFREELNADKVKSTEGKWLEEHPDFNTPEMQAEIRKVTAKGGVHDAVSAYYDIKGQLTAAKLDEMTAKMEEDARLAELGEGENEVGKVVTGPGAGTQQKTHTKLPKGEGFDTARDQGMRDVLKNMA